MKIIDYLNKKIDFIINNNIYLLLIKLKIC
jgi:hypothetical protein